MLALGAVLIVIAADYYGLGVNKSPARLQVNANAEYA
jgi:hypothetical protein